MQAPPANSRAWINRIIAFSTAWADAMEGRISTSPTVQLTPAQFQELGLQALQAVRHMPAYADITQDMVTFSAEVLGSYWRYGDQLQAVTQAFR
jgi:hypothetical protein